MTQSLSPMLGALDPETIDLLKTVGIWSGAILATLFLIVFFVKSFLKIGRPNELLIFSGRKHKLPGEGGAEVGWRYIAGGRAIRWPIIERVDRMDITIMPIDISIRGAYAKGNIPVNVDAVANVKITLDEPDVHHAIERFLGKTRDEISKVARETLEGTLRGVLAQLTPEEINHDRQKLSETLRSEVSDDLGRLGLQVDTFKIQHVTDDVRYLDSISRVRIAEVVRDAEIAESDAGREAEQAIAAANMRGKVAVERSLSAIAEKENELALKKAELEAQAKSEEERTIAAAREARAMAEQRLQAVRKELEALRLEAEQVIPALRGAEAQALRAAGDAAIKAETGRAQGEALAALYAAWSSAGPRAREVFLIQQIDGILADVASVTESLAVDRVTLIDGGDGESLARYVGSFPQVVSEILMRIKETVGIDVSQILSSGPTSLPAATTHGGAK
ncbi:MAG: flotillin family protein [Deltaproteobacteria bacterium]|nr:flotillin family protein [Deltaproteobacteria bacterium]